MTIKNLISGAALMCLTLAPATGFSQGLFDPVARVDGAVITEFELEQRTLFLNLLGAPTGTRDDVLEELIKDKLRLAATADAEIFLSDEALEEGLATFAARTELSTEEFIKQLESDGVSRETFRDFVATSLVWRDYIRARYGNRVRISDEEIDRAVQSVGSNTSIDVLVSEIIIPVQPETEAEVQLVAQEIAGSTSQAEFSDYAARYSATASRDNGGRLDWVPITDLPPQLRPILLALAPGEVTTPLPIPNAVALFQLRDIRERAARAPQYASIDYATYYIPGGRTPEALQRARDLRASIDRCDDLYGIAKGQPVSVLDREKKAPGDIPQDIAIELAKLDANEVSTALTRNNGSTLVFLMLCGRTSVSAENDKGEVDREAVSTELRNRRLSALSDTLLDELAADANIVILE